MDHPPRLPYADRREGGRALARALHHWRDRPGLLVLALPRGGVAVGFEVAEALDAPLDVFVVRKLGYPGHEEFAMGAIASGGVHVMNDVAAMHSRPADIERVVERELRELRRRELLYRAGRGPLDLRERSVIVVDDGLATGATMRAAAQAIRQLAPLALCIAAPVGAADTCRALRGLADELVCPARPEPFRAVGQWYREFPQASDTQVRDLLGRAEQRLALAHL